MQSVLIIKKMIEIISKQQFNGISLTCWKIPQNIKGYSADSLKFHRTHKGNIPSF